MKLADAVVWHDVECASYDADLEVWRELAGAGPVLDVGCGTGRVALDLAARGVGVCGIDADADLIAALKERAAGRGLEVDAVVADARSFRLDRRVAVAIAPMQVVQLMGGADGRAAMLRSVREHLVPGGVFAAALADPFEGEAAEDVGPPLPDVREDEGWVFSSVPIAVRTENGATAIDRLRQAVSPGGELDESMTTIVLDALDPEDLEREAAGAGFAPLPRRRVPESGDYVGSTVVVLEAV